MTDVGDYLMAEVLDRPDENGPRLVLADWLEEYAGFAERPCDVCSEYIDDPDNPWRGKPGYRPERSPASGRHEGGWSNCKTCNSGGKGHVRAGVVCVDNGYAARAEFIRVQCELATIQAKAPTVRPPQSNEWLPAASRRVRFLASREAELLKRHGREWLPKIAGVQLQFLGQYLPGQSPVWYPGDEPVAVVGFLCGFPSVISLTVEQLLGHCGRCHGERNVYDFDVALSGDNGRVSCPTCHGTGRLPPLGPAIAAVCPVRKWVLTGKRPDESLPVGGIEGGARAYWWQRTNDPISDGLPPALFDLLQGGFLAVEGDVREYPTADAALVALNNAVNAHVRPLAAELRRKVDLTPAKADLFLPT